MLNKIWPWSTIDRLATALDKSEELGISWMERAKAAERDRDNAMSDLETALNLVTQRTAERDRYLKQIEDYTRKAKADVRSGYIMHDKQQATDIKFRSVKVDLQCMKKINKQASVAIRYVAQHVKSNALQSDLRAIAEIIHPDTFNEMGIEHMRSADMVEDTRQMQELIAKSNGKVAD